MKDILSLNYFKSFFTRGNERTLRAKRNVLVSFICKGISMIISFLIVPLTLGYVGKVEYGIWMTIAAIIQWFTFFDLGLGNGLRNKLAEALALNETEQARVYISSVFALITGISVIIFLCFLILVPFISWNSVLNTDIVSNSELARIVSMVIFFFCIGFIFNILSSILQARQQYALNDIFGLTAQLLGLAAIFILVKTTEGSLFNLCLIYGGKSAVTMMFASIFLFSGPLKAYRPSLKYVNIKKALPLLHLGIKFFIIQILYMVVTQTSVIIVAQFFGSENVTTYNLAVSYMAITSMGYMMILTPFLSAFTEAYTKNEFSWIKETIKKINLIWILTSSATIVLVLVAKIFFHFWVGDQIQVPLTLIISLALSGIVVNWSSTYSLFLNGIGKIHLQIYLIGAQAIMFLPLSYLFFKCNLGLMSTVLAQIIIYFTSALFMTIQYKKVINQRAEGIWNM